MHRTVTDESTRAFRALVYLAPHGAWAWRVCYGEEDLVRGAGYLDWLQAREDCREFLAAYDARTEVEVQLPALR